MRSLILLALLVSACATAQQEVAIRKDPSLVRNLTDDELCNMNHQPLVTTSPAMEAALEQEVARRFGPGSRVVPGISEGLATCLWPYAWPVSRTTTGALYEIPLAYDPFYYGYHRPSFVTENGIVTEVNYRG